MKNKHGFTLIELLAVIVVLAIIVLIATPIVINTINNAKKGAKERSGENYIKQVEVAIATKRLEESTSNISSLDGTYTINSDGNLEGNNLTEPLVIEVSGNKPTSGTIIVKDGEVQDSSIITIEDYSIVYSEGKCRVTKIYKNGEVVYFNVTTGTKCTDYTESQSNTGVKSGCMKFYAFNDNGVDTVNLILDHNTTATIAWVSKEDYIEARGIDGDYDESSKNDKGPLTLLKQLQTDTESWVGTETPANYTMDQSTQPSNAYYTIDYSNYKARLITANEVVRITGNTSWDEKLSTGAYYYFDSKTSSESTTCKGGNTTGCSYGWLYDRTSTECTTYGCLNNADSSMAGYGYWTASSISEMSDVASQVWDGPFLGTWGVNDDMFFGVRPVIEVLKSNLN